MNSDVASSVRHKKVARMADEEESGFLQRWSKRKLENEDADVASAPERALPVAGRMNTDPPLSHLSEVAEREGEPSDGHDQVALQLNADADGETPAPATPAPMTAEDIAAIDFEALDANSDYTRFMQDGVPDWVRRKALNKLYMTNPIFNELDGLDYYDEDFTDAVWAVGKVETSYKVGRGFMSDEEVAEWEALGAPEDREDAVATLPDTDSAAGDDGEPRDIDEALPQEVATDDSTEPDHQDDEPDVADEEPETDDETVVATKDPSDNSNA